MNDKQRKLFKAFLLLVCSLLLAITIVISFAVHQNQLAQKGDIFDQVAEKVAQRNIMTWVSPVLVLLIGIGVTAAVLFIGLRQVYKTPPHRKSKRASN